jgi:hypothetical protein
MQYALISDIHGNLPALEAVIADLGKRADADRGAASREIAYAQ